MTTKKNKIKRNKTIKTIKLQIEDNCKSVNIVSFDEKDIQKKVKSSEYLSLENNVIRDFKQAVSPSGIKPQNDFYSYINERWLKTFNVTSKQTYLNKYDDFRLTQDKVYNDLHIILEDYFKENKHNKSPFNKSFINFCRSTELNNNTKKQTMKNAYDCVNKIDELLQKNTMFDLLAWINSNELISWGSPLIWGIKADSKDPQFFSSYITGPRLSLIDINVYFNDGTQIEHKKIYIKKYISYLKTLFEYFFGKNHTYDVNDVFKVEQKIADAFSCNEIKVDPNNRYNKITATKSIEKYNFDWKTFAKCLGFKKHPEFFIAADENYLLCITRLLLKEWNTQEWRTYWIYIYIRMLSRFNNDSRNIFFDFNGKFQEGLDKMVDYDFYRLFPIGYAFNTFLSDQYIAKFYNKEIVHYVQTLSENLRMVFSRILKRNTWLNSLTKQRAIKKIDNIQLLIAAPKNLIPDAILDYNDTDMWNNLIKTSLWRHNKAIELEGHKFIDLPVVDWSAVPPKFVSDQAYIVNSSYTPSNNSLYVPLGYIQKPFIDLNDRGLEYNLAFMGFTLAHELSHSLDNIGHKYDRFGHLNDWWTKKDNEKFLKIQEDVVKQYEVFASYDNISYNAWPTIGEDLADIAGLSICMEYLQDFHFENKSILPVKDLSFKMFYTFFAFQERQKIKKRAIISELKTNPHPLDKYRCNVPLSRSKIFRTIYNVKKNDKMWWPNTHKIWHD